MQKQIKVRIVQTKRDGVVLKWTDPNRGPRQIKAEGTTQRKWNQQARDLEDDLNHRQRELTWIKFWERFETSYLSQYSQKHQNKCNAMSERIQAEAKKRNLDPFLCRDVKREMITAVETTMRSEGLAEASITSCMQTLWSVLSWGMDEELIPPIRRPRKRKGKTAKQGSKKAKGRSLTLEEIERMEMSIPAAKKDCELAEPFLRAIKCCYLMGFRLDDCWQFRWDPQPDAHYPLNLDGKTPYMVFSDLQKSGIEQDVPLTPPAVEWLKSIREESGWVCRTIGFRGMHETPDRLCRVLSKAGELANIVVKATGGKRGKPKYASAHDLRRTFATHWHQKLTVSELQQLTRHADSQTLLNYYADSQRDVLAEKLSRFAESILSESGG